MADAITPGSATVLPPDPDLLPALRPLASRPAARDALLWRPHDPQAPTGVLLPADLRAEAASLLEPRGFRLLAEDLRLDPATPSRGPGGAPLTLPRGPRDLYAPRRAWAELVATLPGAPDVLQAALDAALAEVAAPRDQELLRRAAQESDLLALGDLLETTALEPGPATARLVRALAAAHAPGGQAGDRLGDLVRVLQHDHAAPGVSPLARLALGAALWQRLAGLAAPDARVEAALAAAALSLPPAGPPPGPFEPPTPLDLAPLEAVPATQVGSGRGADVQQVRRGQGEPETLAAAARLGQDVAFDEGARLALLLDDVARGLPAALRRRRARRLLAGRDPARAQALLPELAGLDQVVAGLAGAPDRERALARVRSRLGELAAEEPGAATGELAAARAALAALRKSGLDAQVLEFLDLALASAEGRTDLEARARRALEAWAGAPAPAPAHELAPALEALARAGVEPFDPVAAGPRQLEALVHLHALRRRTGGEPPRALVERLVVRDELGVRLQPLAGQVDREALALLLGMALPLERAASLLLALPSDDARLLLLAPRDAQRWEALLGRARVVAAPFDPDELSLEQAAELVRLAAGGHEGLELPTAVVPCPLLGPGRQALVAPRLAGRPVAPDPALLPRLTALVQALHARGFVLGVGPLLAARLGPDDHLGLAGFEALAAADPARRAAGQRADLERLVALPGELTPAELPDLRAGLTGFLEDLLGEGAALDVREAHAALPPWLRAGGTPEVVRDVLLDLEEEGWASGRFALAARPDGRFELTPGGQA